MGWSFKGLPPGKRVTPIYPMETPNGVRSTVGGRFIPSGLLLAQDFTHKPACQTGERAPQGRFRHQPEQMVHPPFAWQLASFPSLPAERRPRIAPCGTSSPYGHIPWKSRHSKPFLPSYQCIRNWSRLSGQPCQITGSFSCVATVRRSLPTTAP